MASRSKSRNAAEVTTSACRIDTDLQIIAVEGRQHRVEKLFQRLDLRWIEAASGKRPSEGHEPHTAGGWMFVLERNRERILQIGRHSVPAPVDQTVAEAADPEKEAGIDLLAWLKFTKLLEEQLNQLCLRLD
jgi:hypothetical protein